MTVVTMKRKSFIKDIKKDWMLYTMLIILVVSLFIFNYIPMAGIQIAFKDYIIPLGNRKGGIWGSPWAKNDFGQIDLLKNFKILFSDPKFWTTLKNTLRISSLRIIFGFPVPIILVLLLNELTSEKYKKLVQGISYLPYFISWVIISNIFFDLTKTDSGFQLVLESIFGHQIKFFGDDNLFLLIVILTDIWKNAGWGTIIYFAALSNISPELYEAASIDGANRFQKMFYITLPGLVPAISINLIFALSGIIYGGFDQIYNMYNETVYGKGDILETYLFRSGLLGGDYSLGTALGLFNSIIGLALTLLANKIIKKLGGNGIW